MPRIGYIVLQTAFIVLMVVLNADLLFSIKEKSEIEVTDHHFNGPVLIALIAVFTVITFFLYVKVAWADPGFVQTQVFTNQETEIVEETTHNNKRSRHARKPSTVLEELELKSKK